MGTSASKQLENTLFQLKFTSKQLTREQSKCVKAEKEQKAKLKKAIEQGNHEGARIYAQNAIREKNQGLNYLRLASRVDAVAARVNTALRQQNLQKQMVGVVKGMDKALASMQMDKVAKCMDKFESNFEDLDVRAAYMEGAIGDSTAQSTPQEQVDDLILQVNDEHGLNMAASLSEAGIVPSTAPAEATPAAADAAAAPAGGDLEARLAALRS
eukprot:g2082.t1